MNETVMMRIWHWTLNLYTLCWKQYSSMMINHTSANGKIEARETKKKTQWINSVVIAITDVVGVIVWKSESFDAKMDIQLYRFTWNVKEIRMPEHWFILWRQWGELRIENSWAKLYYPLTRKPIIIHFCCGLSNNSKWITF